MALIRCPECESQVSTRAHACPRCGYPVAELTSFRDAITHNHSEAVRDLIRAGFSMDEFDSQGKTPLMLASRLGTVEIAAILIEAGATLDLQRNDGSTALMDAVSNGHKEIVGLLLNAGADRNMKNKEGLTPLDLALHMNKLNVLSMFQSEENEQVIPPPLPEDSFEKQSFPPPLPIEAEPMRQERAYEHSDLICKNCNSQIAPEEIWCSHCKAPIIRRYCGGCKRLIPEVAARCPHCNSAKIARFRYIRNLEQIIVSGAVIGLIAGVVGLYAPHRKIETGAPVAAVQQNVQKEALPPLTPSKAQAKVVSHVSKVPESRVTTAEKPWDTAPDAKARTKTQSLEQAQSVQDHADLEDQQDAQDTTATVSWYGTAQRLNDAGFRLMKQGRYEEAIPVLARSLQSFPSDARRNLTYAYALFNLGRSLRLAGRPDLAIPILKERMKYADQRDVVARELALANQDLGEPPASYIDN